MRVNKGISVKEKRRYALDHMGGVDFSSSPLNCSPTRSPNAVNWIGDHGINRKRHGWEQVQLPSVYYDLNSDTPSATVDLKAFDGEIHSITVYKKLEGGIRYFVHEGTNIWSIAPEGYNSVKLKGNFKKAKSQAFLLGDSMWFVNAAKEGGLLCVKGSGIVEGKDPYIPTTTINIGVDSEKDDLKSVLDSANLLTTRRKNKLVGVNGTSDSRWTLDARIKKGTLVKISASVLYPTSENGVDTYKIEEREIYTKGGDDLYMKEDKEEKAVGYADFENGKISLSIHTTPPIKDDSNITVEFDADIDDRSDRINGCTFGTLFGVSGARDRLFLSGNPKYPNVVFFSNFNDPTYFPDQFTATCGTDADAITGMLCLSDSTLAVMKRNAIYYLNGEYEYKYNAAGELLKMTPIFRITAGSINEGCLNPFAVASFGTDDLFVSRNGVYAIEPTSDVLTNTRVARERSRSIAARFPLANEKDVSCFVHGQHLFVTDGSGACYVADTAYKYMPEGSEDYSYEWWYWDNIPATTWAEVNGELWFGTNDGRICRFTEGYKDVSWDYTADGELTLNTLNNDDTSSSFTYNEKDNVGEIVDGRRVRFTTEGWSDARGDLKDVDLYAYIKDKSLYLSRYEDATSNEYIKVVANGTNPILRVYNDRPVVAEWSSPPLDFGTDAYSKTLFSMTVTAETGKNSMLEFGYETRRKAQSFSALGLNVFSFEEMDFSAFSFENGFQSSYTVRARDRNFNFLRFHLRSDGDKPCAVHRISALYKINKENKGVV